ncbi:meiosis expressed gene 1 protein homolog isoform X1 [Microcaecilia unicolor]|uniref:Meiosis expressed gene 1 protein homolog isoform X1 n=1 Tax=Microcaecilia unicolor TaxID=1415580 RepID=A0A6P7Z4L8_9AMPH|nr:meiosis expressed gene 1 protein homolog isoform X1 [Microcaecilia unicolor]
MSDEVAGAMAAPDVKPKSISRAKKWSDEIENLYRFQQAGYRDEIEYKQVKHVEMLSGGATFVINTCLKKGSCSMELRYISEVSEIPTAPPHPDHRCLLRKSSCIWWIAGQKQGL